MLAGDGLEDRVDDREAPPEARAVGDRQPEPDRRDPGRVELAGDAVDAPSVLGDPGGRPEGPTVCPPGTPAMKSCASSAPKESTATCGFTAAITWLKRVYQL